MRRRRKIAYHPPRAVGVGMFVAIVVDVSLVRVLLVPATMRLLGPANWWPSRRPRPAAPAAAPPQSTPEPGRAGDAVSRR